MSSYRDGLSDICKVYNSSDYSIYLYILNLNSQQQEVVQ